MNLIEKSLGVNWCYIHKLLEVNEPNDKSN